MPVLIALFAGALTYTAILIITEAPKKTKPTPRIPLGKLAKLLK